MANTKIGCDKCRTYCALLVERNLCIPHKDIVCGDCGERDARTYRSIKAAQKRGA